MTVAEQVRIAIQTHLTQAQGAVALDGSPELLALACAGSGKSRTLAFRIARLIADGVEPQEIVAFTFTNKAAESLKQRISEALQRSGQDPLMMGAMFVGTIDSFTKTMLGSIDARFRQFDQLDPNRMKLYLMSRYAQLNVHVFRNARGLAYFETIDQIADAFETAQNLSIEHAALAAADPELADLLDRLRGALDRDEYIDFTTACRVVAEAFENVANHPDLPHVAELLVDEYQDINPLQQRLIDALRGRGAHLFAVGDDDQAIFGWRGADVSNILSFERRYAGATVLALNHNFRSTTPIVSAADRFISAEIGANRMPKTPVAAENRVPQDFAILSFPTQSDEAQAIAARINELLGKEYVENDERRRGLMPADFAILMKSTRRGDYANEARHQIYTDALSQLGIPFVVESTGDLFERAHVVMVRDAMELLRVSSPNRNTVATFFNTRMLPLFVHANVQEVYSFYAKWGRLIHPAPGGPRQRLFPQELLHDLLEAVGVGRESPPDNVMYDLGTFSRILQDVETVYPSVDSASRYAAILNFLRNPADGGYEINLDDAAPRPNAVFVSTIHKAKGLEFPVVFIVDCRQTQYPGRRGAYRGLIPAALMAPAIQAGSYVHGPDQAARLFYTAVTRAERYLYVTFAENIPANIRPARLSQYALRLDDGTAIRNIANLSPAPAPTAPALRSDESDLPTSFSDIKYYLRCPKDYKFRKVFGFSPPIGEMFGFGLTVHTAIGKLHERFANIAPTRDDATHTAEDTFHLKHAYPSNDPVGRPGPYERARESAKAICGNYAASHPDDFENSKQVELRFEIPVYRAVMTGSIDLLVRRDQNGLVTQAEVIDFKAIRGDDDPLENEELDWRELSLQVQLYARAANEVLGENARTGSVHLLKDNQRVEVPIDDQAIAAAVSNVEWAVSRIISRDFPMRPQGDKCGKCDFQKLCTRRPEDFENAVDPPPALHIPNGEQALIAAYSEFEPAQLA
jgi:DNA helicase-2/ATP-dependent DNA helicase PcrA